MTYKVYKTFQKDVGTKYGDEDGGRQNIKKTNKETDKENGLFLQLIGC